MGRCSFLGGLPGRTRRSDRGMAAVPLVAPVASADSRWDGPRGARSYLMPRIGPIRRQDFIFYLRRMGFEGPYAGGRHQLMQKGLQTVRVPNPTEETSAPAFWPGFFAIPASIEWSGRSCRPF